MRAHISISKQKLASPAVTAAWGEMVKLDKEVGRASDDLPRKKMGSGTGRLC